MLKKWAEFPQLLAAMLKSSSVMTTGSCIATLRDITHDDASEPDDWFPGYKMSNRQKRKEIVANDRNFQMGSFAHDLNIRLNFVWPLFHDVTFNSICIATVDCALPDSIISTQIVKKEILPILLKSILYFPRIFSWHIIYCKKLFQISANAHALNYR